MAYRKCGDYEREPGADDEVECGGGDDYEWKGDAGEVR